VGLKPEKKKPSPSPSAGERWLVFGIFLAAFGYFLYRVFWPLWPWPEADDFWLRVAEAGAMGVLALGGLIWALRATTGKGPS
jgi:hypothetical protein